MSKINVSKCKYYSTKEYISNNNGYTEYPDYCSCYVDGHCLEHPNCYYKQLQQLKVENENLKQKRDLYKTWYRVKQLCLYEIEEIVKDGDICCNDCRRLILNKIKEVKGNE